MSDQTLLPCPFCGSKNIVVENLVDEHDYFVSCEGCSVQQIANYSREVAIARWNMRAGRLHGGTEAGSEQAYRITSPMLQALNDLDLCTPAPHFIPNRSVAVALLNRNWVRPAEGHGQKIESKTLYFLTAAGSKVLRIERQRETRRKA